METWLSTGEVGVGCINFVTTIHYKGISRMRFWQFAFPFLFVRNWETGMRELSRPRFAIFCSGLFLFFLSLLLISILQQPVRYEAGVAMMYAIVMPL